MRFIWDDNKAQSNFVKHGIRFEEAVTVFGDPYLMFTEDSQHSRGEEREWAIGEAENGGIMVVVFTMREEQMSRLRINDRDLTINDRSQK